MPQSVHGFANNLHATVKGSGERASLLPLVNSSKPITLNK
jgi:hypothetical protein